jgi:hypothetical protein
MEMGNFLIMPHYLSCASFYREFFRMSIIPEELKKVQKCVPTVLLRPEMK